LKRRFSSGYSRRLTSQGHGGPVPAVGCLLIFEAERRPRNGVQPGHRDYSAADLADSIGASFDSAQRIKLPQFTPMDTDAEDDPKAALPA